ALLRTLDRHARLVGVVTVLLLAAACLVVPGFRRDFLPELRENHFVVHMRGIPGTSLQQSMAAGNRMTALVHSDQVRSICQQAGRAELGEDTWGVEYSEIEVDLQPGGAEDAEKAERELKRKLGTGFAGFQFEVLPFLSERIKETLSGSPAAVAVKIYGDDLE